MQEHEKPARRRDPVEEASGQSFPASDPPAWTAARAGMPEGQAGKEARRDRNTPPPQHCEVVGLFRSNAEAEPAADALLASGFDLVDIGSPRSPGNRSGGIGAHVRGAPSQAAQRIEQQRTGEPDWPPNAALLRVRLKSPGDQKRALAILEAQGARKIHVSRQ